MAAQPPFTRIYLDTEPLTRSNWPNVSATLEKLVSAAARVTPAIEVFLPEPVEQELEAQFSRDYAKAVRDLPGSPTKVVNKLLSRAAQAPLATIEPPPIDAVLEAYRQHVAAAKQQMNVAAAVPLTTRTLAEVFQMRLRREKPFDEEGHGLGDVLILHSIIDHLLATPGQVGLLVTADGHFQNVAPIAARRGAQLQTMKIEAAIEATQARLAGHVMQILEEHSQQARQSVEVVLPELTAYARANLEAEMTEFTEVGETLEKVEELERIEIEGVQVSPFFAAVAVGQQATLTIYFSAHFRVTVQSTVYPPLPRVKVGEGSEALTRQMLIAMLRNESAFEGKKESHQKNVKILAEAKATARRTNTGYDQIVWTSVSTRNPPPSLRALYELAG